MVGIFALVIGILVMSMRPDLVHRIYNPHSELSFHSIAVSESKLVDRALELFRQGNIEQAKLAFLDCAGEPDCDYMLNEIEFYENAFDTDLIRDPATKTSNPNSQYLHALMLSNKFTNVTEYTSKTFPLSVLYLYAASTAGHPGALMAMGYRHMHGYGVPKRCETAALNYLEVAKPVANIYANSVPKAVELVRLGIEKDKKFLSLPEISLFTEVANTNPEIALAVGKRFLLGTDGFGQDYAQSLRFLMLAAVGGAPPVAASAWALLGYIHALGLGVDVDVEKAEDFFQRGLEDGLGLNGMGFIRFKQDRFSEAFGLFNQSAAAGSADGMFNLASVYLTGTGTGQNFQKAFMWFTEALRRGHTPAGYALAVMHLNGIGTIRDCSVAVSLLKEVAERGDFVSQTLRSAHALLARDETKDLAVLQLLKLAEAGHQVSQENLAHLIDSGKAGEVLFDTSSDLERQIYAQRFYELASEQGSVTSELRLGDYAYYGWGIKADFAIDSQSPGLVGIVHKENEQDFKAAKTRYAKARDDATRVASVSGGNVAWINKVIGTASFNLGYMYQFGIGVRANAYQASNHYRKAVSKESHGAWILEWLIDTFVHPRPVEEAPVQGSADSASQAIANEQPNRYVSMALDLFKDFRIIVVMILSGLLMALIGIRNVVIATGR